MASVESGRQSHIGSFKLLPLKRGDKIAIKDQAGGEIPRLNVQLEKVGLQPNADVEYVQFGENTALAASMLVDGKVDALEISWNSLVGVDVALNKQGRKLRCVSCAEQEATASESLIVSNEVFDKRRDLVEKVGRALAQATLYGNTNPDATLAIMRRVNPEEQVDAAYAKSYFDAALEIMKPRPARNQYGWQDPAVWQRSMELLLTPGIPAGLTEKVDINAVINNDLIAAYNSFDREAVIQAAKAAKS